MNLEISIFLAKVIGVLAVITSLAVMLNYKKSVAFEIELSKNPASVYASGFLFLVMGVLILVSHPVFEMSWMGVITLLGIAISLKGIGRIFMPESVNKMIEKKQKTNWFMLGEVGFLLIGLYLSYYGFIVY